MFFSACSIAGLRVTAPGPPFVVVGSDAGTPVAGTASKGCRDDGRAAKGALRQDLFNRALRDEDEFI